MAETRGVQSMLLQKDAIVAIQLRLLSQHVVVQCWTRSGGWAKEGVGVEVES